MSNEAATSDHDSTTQRPAQAQPGEKPLHGDDLPDGVAPEDVEGEIGAEGGSHSPSNKTPTPAHPAKDSSPLGDTDQHSNA